MKILIFRNPPEEVIEEICKLANKITNLTEEHSQILFWGLWLTTEIFIKNEKTRERVRTMTLLNGSSINEILHKKEYELIEEGKEEGKELGMEKRNIEIASKMINEGLPAKLISKITELDINTIKQLKP